LITGVADRATARIANAVYLDAAYPSDGQSLGDVAGAMTQGRYWHIDTGHDLMISAPGETAGVLLEIAKHA
jgi:hypothetical protein